MDSEFRLAQLLDQAIELDRASKGTIQILDAESESLKIVAHRGFDEKFLRHFETVKRFDSSACGRAFGSETLVMISDILEDKAFQPNREVVQANGVRSVKCVPIINADGRLQGVLSTHSSTVRWNYERDNTRHIAAELAGILSKMRAARR